MEDLVCRDASGSDMLCNTTRAMHVVSFGSTASSLPQSRSSPPMDWFDTVFAGGEG